MTLFINCCPRGESRTEKLARALLKALGEYEELRLYDEPLHPLGRADIAKRDKLLAEKKYDDEMFCYARQFAAADRIVIAAPYWDLSFPAQLKRPSRRQQRRGGAGPHRASEQHAGYDLNGHHPGRYGRL